MSEPAKILVIDDDESVRGSLAAVLEAQGYSVDTAADGKEAIEMSSRNYYNLAIIDIRLPDMEGTKLLTEIKEKPPGMVKIILTGYPSMETAIEAVNKGANGYLIKPINAEDLLNKIKQHLKKQQEK
jgi:DNA-binding NtrC family response regulator